MDVVVHVFITAVVVSEPLKIFVDTNEVSLSSLGRSFCLWMPKYDLNHPHSVVFLQKVSIPALCRNSSGNTRLQGTVSQTADTTTAHAVRFWTDSLSWLLTRIPTNLNHSAPIMAVIVWKALFFVWSMRSLFWSLFPGPGRIKMQRTERLQKVATHT